MSAAATDSTSTSSPPCSTSSDWMSSAAPALNDITSTELDDLITENTTVNEIRTETHPETVFSPMNFMQCERGIGQPKKKRFGAPSLSKTKINVLDDTNEGESKKSWRGRPKGAKNKQKDEPATKKRKTEKSLRQRAEEAAYGDIIVNKESCQICQFKFSDPIKQNKPVTRCPDCNVLVHEPCLQKSGCLSDECFLIV